MTTIAIEPKNITDDVNDSIVLGQAATVDLVFQYNSSIPDYAVGHFCIKDADGKVLRARNRNVSTEGWTDDDSVMYDNFLTVLGLTKLN